MKKDTKIQKLGRSELEALAEKALTNQERNRQASAKIRQAKKEAGLQQISVWLPRGSSSVERFKEAAEALCDQYLAARPEQTDSPAKSSDLDGQDQAPKSPANPPANTAGGEGV